MIVRSQSSYNGIIERPGVRKLQVVPSTAHGMLKIPVEGGVITLKSSKLVPLECAMVSGPAETPSATKPIAEERVKVAINPKYPEQTVMIGSTLTEGGRNKLLLSNTNATEDEEKTSFITSQGIFCYTKMLFGLRNTGATYQRLVDKAFHKQISRNLEVYVDDLIIKSHTEDEIVRDIEETFKTLREINMKLNPKKVEEGMFLGYKVNTKWLKVCPNKVDVMLSLPSPKCLKDVQKLNGKLAMNRFLAKSERKSLSFFKTLKKCTKKSNFHWTTEAEDAFKKMKKLIPELPMLTTPMEKEELIVYLAATKETVSAVLMMKREAKQMPIYFVSRALSGPELNYTSMEKLVLALVHASKRLKGEYSIHYRPRVSVKGQILADFIVERPEDDSSDTPMEEAEELPKPWILFTDGSSCTDGSGAGLILTNPEGMEFTHALRFWFDATNNEAEYEALIAEIRIAEQMGVKNLQANGGFTTGSFKAFSIKQIPRSENKKADALSKIASISFAHLSKQVLVKELKEKSISEIEILAVEEEKGDTWMTHLFKYLAKETLPADVKKARAIKRKSWRFAVVNETLYKKSFLGPWLRCVGTLQANYVQREIHEGSCSMYAGTRSVVAKALRTGYYWPTMHRDAMTLIKACQHCQWGIDIARPFPKGLGKVKFLIVAMDYFTKWIEAKPVVTITGNQIKKFTWDNIVCKFGLSEEIISDNGKQFRDDPFKDWCEKLCICQHFAFVKHSQTNGLVERANRRLKEGIKSRLDARSKNRIEELPHVLWAHRTMIKSSNGITPFSLTYETEAIIPAEIGMPTLRTAEVDLVGNNEALEINLDILEERREDAAIREAKIKANMEKYYSSKVRNTSFKPGDLVYHKNEASRANDTGKLGPKWEGPYKVTKVLGNGAYKLRGCDEKQLLRT
nr:reverse transcriptase domain-containing protein [Tanacetum cinerariifolium]